MGTAIEARDALKKLDGVIRVHPNGLNGKALVYVKDKKTFTEDKVKEAFKGSKDLTFRKMEVTNG